MSDQTLPADCPSCKFFGIDCNPDLEDYEKPCDAFKPIIKEGETEEWN